MRFFFDVMERKLRNYWNLGEKISFINENTICKSAKDLWSVLGEEGINDKELEEELKSNGQATREFLTRIKKLGEYSHISKRPHEKIRKLFEESLEYVPEIIEEIEEIKRSILNHDPGFGSYD